MEENSYDSQTIVLMSGMLETAVLLVVVNHVQFKRVSTTHRQLVQYSTLKTPILTKEKQSQISKKS